MFKGWAYLAQLLTGCEALESWPHLSLLAALEESGPELRIDSTSELTLLVEHKGVTQWESWPSHSSALR